MNCPGPVDYQGCVMPDTCVAAGEPCPFYCPYVPPMDCGEGHMSCPGPVDGMGCKTMDQCVPYGEQCPHNCPHVPFIAPDGLPRGIDELPWMGRLHGLQSRRH